ncbi:putative bifunctional diguanylate cyclase/phosphodiesterase [Vibrio splendidus]|uniref:putative bifunctional diguanylate cyclase/phosphodiesterase n=1 Tax=Vibrio splendidus TaxID=29497 RepID=UPI001E483657|nr:EAL domain-containing protein [Vibrio splendidus]MCC4861941.1 EAL domain-containing protein [Vibrio splendidus]
MISVGTVRPTHQFTEFNMMTNYQPFEHLKCPIWIYDIDNKRITWANSNALPLWESESMFELTSRDFSVEMSKAIEATLEEYQRQFLRNESIKTWWNFTPNYISKRALCLFSGIPLPDGRTGMLVQVIAEEGSLKHDLACSDGANLSLLFDNSGNVVSANSAFLQNYGSPFSTLADFVSSEETAAQWLFAARKGREILEEVSCEIDNKTHHFDVQGKWLFDKSELLLNLICTTKQKEKLLKARYNAEHDCLTELYNRRGITNLLETSIAYRSPFELMFVDLDGFKLVNDTYGHSVGDQLLKQVGERLKHLVDETCMIGRFGGDEFIVIAHACRNHNIPLLCSRIIEALNKSFHIRGIGTLSVGCSIGTAHFPDNAVDQESLLKQAGMAMHMAKANGRNRFQTFTPCLAQTLHRKVEIRHRLTHALENDDLNLHYQPIMNTNSDKVKGFEALLRWSDEELGDIAPDEFITLAEESGQIVPLGKWVLNSALKQLSMWQREFDHELMMSINISSIQMHATFAEQLSAMLNFYNIQPQSVALEITESSMIFKHGEVRQALSDISKLGVELHLDDFGTGYSSLSMLHDLPISTVKLDKSFVHGSHKGSKAIVQATHAICDKLGLKVVAEGVETEMQKAFLIDCGYQYLQGFLFSKPIPSNEVERQFLAGRLIDI